MPGLKGALWISLRNIWCRVKSHDSRQVQHVPRLVASWRPKPGQSPAKARPKRGMFFCLKTQLPREHVWVALMSHSNFGDKATTLQRPVNPATRQHDLAVTIAHDLVDPQNGHFGENDYKPLDGMGAPKIVKDLWGFWCPPQGDCFCG